MMRRRQDVSWKRAALGACTLRTLLTLVYSQDGGIENASRNISRNISATPEPLCNVPRCCTTLVRDEARLSCLSYELWGITSEVKCKLWEDFAEQGCVSSCGDCMYTARQVFQACLMLLTSEEVAHFENAVQYCRGTERAFKDQQCPSACLDRVACFTLPARACSILCDNYKPAPALGRSGCNCIQRRTVTGMPDDCVGDTVQEGLVHGRVGLRHSCLLIPDECKNHRPETSCGLYKHCPVNICTMNDVQCPMADGCLSQGTCMPFNGQCHRTQLPEGSSCDDGLFYTHNDRCVAGTCMGTVNKCLRDAVECVSTNRCLRPTSSMVGACHNETGSCVFEALPDGTPCASILDAYVADEGICHDGLCHREYVDSCSNISCAVHGQCFETVPCPTASGGCVPRPRLEGMFCNDGDNGTHSDRCMEGRCVGDPIDSPKFTRLSEEACHEVTGKARRYFADVPDVEDCKEQCRLDPECNSFTYGYHVCSIFGTSRIASPRPGAQGAQWMLEAASAAGTQYKVACFQKTVKHPLQVTRAEPTLLALTICLLTVPPMLWLVVVNGRPLYRSCRRLWSGGDEDGGGVVVADSLVVPMADELLPAEPYPALEAKRHGESKSHSKQPEPPAGLPVPLPADLHAEVQLPSAVQ